MECCPICESKKCKISSGNNGVYSIDCTEGFSFEICQSYDNLSDIEKRKVGNLVLEWLLSHSKVNNKAKFRFQKESESLIIENNEINLTTLIETYPKTVIERVNRALINLASRYPNIGDQIGINNLDTALIFVESEDYISESEVFLVS